MHYLWSLCTKLHELYWRYMDFQAKIWFIWKFSFSLWESFKWYYNSLFTLILDDFNAKSLVWWTRDKATIEGTQLESLTTVHNITIHSHTATNLILHWNNIHWSTKFNSWWWCTSFITFELLSSDYVLQTWFSYWFFTFTWAFNLGLQ